MVERITGCCMDGCERPAHVRGWCVMHYARWRRHGDPLTTRRTPKGLHVVCTVAGCDRSHYCRGWCKGHHQRWLSHGDVAADIPLSAVPGGGWPRKRIDPSERFWAKVDKTPTCWVWTGALAKDNRAGCGGYGSVAARTYGTNVAHRFAWMDLIGPIPEGMVLDHECRNRACVRPGDGHVRLVTPYENNTRNHAQNDPALRGR